MLKKLALLLSFGAVCFFGGYQTALLNDNPVVTTSLPPIEKQALEQGPTTGFELVTNQLERFVEKATAVPQLDQSALAEFIEHQSDAQIYDRVASLFGEQAVIENIADVRQFSLRLVEELENEHSDISAASTANLYFGLESSFPESPVYAFEVSPRQKLYAHIDVQGGLGSTNSKFFIRWKHLDSNEVLLFTHKKVLPSSDKNWVSFKPDENWKEGNYQVTFFQFTSELEALASETYSLLVKADQ